jgi:hypothetical protein
LVTLIASLARDSNPVTHTEWDNRRVRDDERLLKPSVFLRVGTVVQEGRDATDHVEDDDDGELYEEVSGHRLITLQIKCEHSSDTDAFWSGNLSEAIRTRLNRRSSIDTLLALGCSLVEADATIHTYYVSGRKRINVSVFDAIIRCTFVDVDPDPSGYWTHVLLTSELTSGETLLPEPPNFTDEQLGPV